MTSNVAQNRWAVLIGINGYHESLGRLSFCINDAMLMSETLLSECCGFSWENIVVLTDDQAKERLPTFGNIHSWLGTWLSRPGPDDLVLIYFAGHGREANSEALLAPMDATLESLPVTGIPVRNVVDMLERCPAAQKVLLLDACHSGAGRDVATMSAGFRAAIDAGTGLYTIASCDADQISYEWPEKKQGVFTHYLSEALQHGATAGPEGSITLDAVYQSTRAGILDWTAARRLKQEPVRICRTKGDIHIAARSLSLEQQLAAAKTQVRAHEETIARLRQELAQLTEEKTAPGQQSGKDETSVRQISALAHKARLLTPFLFDDPKKAITHPASFLDWTAGTVLVWVDVTQEHLNAPSNRYVFAHTSNWRDRSGHPNSFSLCAHNKIRGWRLGVYGDPAKSFWLLLDFEPEMIGWRLFAVRWDKAKQSISLSIDADRWHTADRFPDIENWPSPAQQSLWIGAYPSRYRGGETNTRLAEFMLFHEWLESERLQEILRRFHEHSHKRRPESG